MNKKLRQNHSLLLVIAICLVPGLLLLDFDVPLPRWTSLAGLVMLALCTLGFYVYFTVLDYFLLRKRRKLLKKLGTNEKATLSLFLATKAKSLDLISARRHYPFITDSILKCLVNSGVVKEPANMQLQIEDWVFGLIDAECQSLLRISKETIEEQAKLYLHRRSTESFIQGSDPE